jgi:hypothetical protein
LEADAGKGDFYNKAGATRDMCEDDGCKGQFACSLVPFDFGCCPNKTPHHVVPAHCFLPAGERASGAGGRYPGLEKYDDMKAPCICVSGGTKSDSGADGQLLEHGRIHAIADKLEANAMDSIPQLTPTGKPQMTKNKTTGAMEQVQKKTASSWSFKDANDAGCQAVSDVLGCDKECLKAQSEAAHKKMGVDVGPGKSDKVMLRADPFGSSTPDGFVPSRVNGPMMGP